MDVGMITAVGQHQHGIPRKKRNAIAMINVIRFRSHRRVRPQAEKCRRAGELLSFSTSYFKRTDVLLMRFQ
jgi:hypothetical protein